LFLGQLVEVVKDSGSVSDQSAVVVVVEVENVVDQRSVESSVEESRVGVVSGSHVNLVVRREEHEFGKNVGDHDVVIKVGIRDVVSKVGQLFCVVGKSVVDKSGGFVDGEVEDGVIVVDECDVVAD
jgi:hypothetical protein